MLRAVFKKADIIFIKHHDNWISKAIAWFMKSRWSHSVLIVENEKKQSKRTWTCETTDFEVSIGWVERYLEDKNVSMVVFSPIGLTPQRREVIASKCIANYGQVYGYLQLLSLGIRRIFMRFGIRIPNFIRQGMVCNQSVLYGYIHSGFSEFYRFDPESIDTEEFYQLVKNSKNFKVIFEKGV